MRRGGPAAGGFSLLELVVVIVIIGLLAAMGVPKVSLAVEEKRVETAKNGLYTIWTAQRLYRMEADGTATLLGRGSVYNSVALSYYNFVFVVGLAWLTGSKLLDSSEEEVSDDENDLE